MVVHAGLVASLQAAGDATDGGVGGVDLPPGAVICGGFSDHHLHLLATAAARRSVDLSTARSLAEVADALTDAALRTPPGRWLRAWGLDESYLDEQRLPTVDELDRATAGRPLVLHHRTGHLRLHNRAADAAGGPDPLPFDELAEAVAAVGAELLAHGVTAVTDATHTNDRAALELLDRFRLPVRVTAMVGADHLDGLAFGTTVGSVTVGPAKIMPPHHGLDRVAERVAAAHHAGFPVAVHAVDVDELQAALDGGLGPGDRIEHLGLSLPEQLTELAARRIAVVTQPTFVTRRAAKYRRELSEIEQGWLYRLRSAVEAGVELRGSSDAPVVPARPLEQVAAAMTRTVTPSERIDVDAALGLIGAPLSVGAAADLVVLAEDPRSVARTDPARVADIAVLAVWRNGRLLVGDARHWPGGKGP